MIKHSWSSRSIQSLYLQAKEKGTVSVELPTSNDAILFRYALYNARRRNRNLNKDPSFLQLRIDIEENRLTIFKPIEIEIKQTGTDN